MPSKPSGLLIFYMKPDYHLQRFVDAQENVYEKAYSEIEQGRKQTHWMWFIFPQISGLGQSQTSIYYAIKNLQEAELYLNHPLLGVRLIRICDVLLQQASNNAHEIFRPPDDKKLFSSMTLFNEVPSADPIFKNILVKYFSGKREVQTLKILNA